MKKIYILTSAILIALTMQAQSVLHYEFTSSLEEVNGNGPNLTVLGNNGIYEENTLDEVGSAQKWVYRFEKNSGFQFDNTAAGNFLGESYTIEIYFVFDELSSWKRVVDWKNRKVDNGAYVYNGELNFYPYKYSDEAPVVAGSYTYYVITRDAVSQNLKIYTDAEIEIYLIDTPGDALLDSDNILNFFYDDLIVPNEASPGAVAMLKLYNYAMDSTEIKDNYDDLAGNIFSIGEKRKQTTPVQFFPNPAIDHLNIDLSIFTDNEKVSLKLINSLGITVFQVEADGGFQQKIQLNTSVVRSGIYLLTAESDSKRASGKVMIKE
jgi:OOP family OmpA-OmpF porin